MAASTAAAAAVRQGIISFDPRLHRPGSAREYVLSEMIRKLLRRRRFMREHRWTHAHLSHYLDGELSSPERHRVEEHVGMCPECRRVLATLRRTLEALMGLGAAEGRPGLADGIIKRLREQP
jgi:Putative zinc-finger